MKERLVIIPTYNEKENAENIIRCVFSLEPRFDVLIIEDNSPDGTAGIVKNLQQEFPNLYMIERKGKLGLGTAYITGFKWALEQGYRYIFEMDADFSHNPKDLVRLYNSCVNGADVSIGSRYVTGVNVVNWPMSRVLLSYFASKYVRIIWLVCVMVAFRAVLACRQETTKTITSQTIRLATSRLKHNRLTAGQFKPLLAGPSMPGQ